MRSGNGALDPRARAIYCQLLAGQRPEIPDDVRLALVSARLIVGGRNSAVRPAEALSELLSRRLPADLAALRRLADLAEMLQGMAHGGLGNNAADVSGLGPAIELLTEPHQRGDAHRATISSAQHELMVVEGTVPAPTPAQITPDSIIRQAGVRWRGVQSITSMDDPELARRAIDDATVMGAEIRLAPPPPVWLTLADDRVAMLSTGPTPRSGVLVIRIPEMLQMLRQWFELLWSTATPMVAQPSADGAQAEADASTRLLMRLLATGLTDEAIGRLLGVSPRTIRRRVADLEAKAGASNRFQLALRAAQLGWISATPA